VAPSPLVSVILPTYNRAALIGPAVQSVLTQTFADLELWVIDDGSTDETRAIVAAIGDPRLHYHRLHRNRGQAVARNEGLRRARGEYVAFQDSDDRWAPGKLERSMEVLRSACPKIGGVYCDMLRVWRDGRVTYHRSPTLTRGRWIDPATGWYQVYMLGIQASLIRRRCLDAVGHFDERLHHLEDMELFMRLSRAYELVRIGEPLVDYVQTSGVTEAMADTWQARWRILRRHAPAILRESPQFVLRESRRILRLRLGR
jgi:glycosyltransferase involved in cell wall biosynthesis